MDLTKGHVLVRQDTICNYIYFIEKGLTRTYYLKNGKDITDWFSFENTVACSILNFITRQADRRIIQLLEPSTLWDKPNAQNLIHPIIRYVKSTLPFTSSFFLKKISNLEKTILLVLDLFQF